eukprot:FR743963.1.p3 GENE.FR743963.1~~FR743963.1.p3  ORF type:complete len:143 (+),score=63.51 FR743963.1:853-1281(+)
MFPFKEGKLGRLGKPWAIAVSRGKMLYPPQFPPNNTTPETKRGKARGGPKEGATLQLIGVGAPGPPFPPAETRGRRPCLLRNPAHPAGGKGGVWGFWGALFPLFLPPPETPLVRSGGRRGGGGGGGGFALLLPSPKGGGGDK